MVYDYVDDFKIKRERVGVGGFRIVKGMRLVTTDKGKGSEGRGDEDVREVMEGTKT